MATFVYCWNEHCVLHGTARAIETVTCPVSGGVLHIANPNNPREVEEAKVAAIELRRMPIPRSENND